METLLQFLWAAIDCLKRPLRISCKGCSRMTRPRSPARSSSAMARSAGFVANSGSEVDVLQEIQRRVLWLSTLIGHHANRVRHNPSDLQGAGHQASGAAVVTLVTGL